MVLCLETATKNCSVSLVHEGTCIANRSEHGQQFVHGERLHVLIKEVLDSAKVAVSDLDAVCVGKGPGSYTGLRIGVSTAKGLCYAHGIPLWSVPTLGCFNHNEFAAEDHATVLSVIDARRDEAFVQVWEIEKGHWIPQSEVSAVIIDEGRFLDLGAKRVAIVGDCASKVQRLLGPRASDFNVLPDSFPDAKYMLGLLASNQYTVESVAYFEPFYLKDFVAEKSKKKWL